MERSKKRYYLAYGSNLNLAQMKRRCPESERVGTAEIFGYRLLFKGQVRHYLTIEEEKGKSVPVGVFAVNEEDESRLDEYEAFPDLYYKKDFKVKLNETGQEIDAFAYIMWERFPLGEPTDVYIETVRQGYKDFGFDFALIEEALSDSKR